ncbi:MAG TPA: hypothetical protein VIH13_04325 [Candidatus Hydromicrobium sp.]
MVIENHNIKCPGCGRFIRKLASLCPYCGAKTMVAPEARRLWLPRIREDLSAEIVVKKYLKKIFDQIKKIILVLLHIVLIAV